ncbi:MAG: VOC family protein [Prolixibacteraceae bacterium]|nr:VOC family protein [Burkholderiales bacterium]
MTLVIPDLDAVKSLLDAEGITIDKVVEGNFGKISHLTDPDGNVITLADPPKGFKQV